MRRVLFVLSLAALAGCASKPWSIIDGEGATAASDDQYNVTILSVDGQAFLDGRMQQKVEPGFHYLQVATTKKSRRGDATYQPFALTAAPCMRYVLFAQHESRLNNEDWSVVLKKQEPISGCETGPAPADKNRSAGE